MGPGVSGGRCQEFRGVGDPRCRAAPPLSRLSAPERPRPGPSMDDLILNVDFAAPERRSKKEPGNRKHRRFVRRRRELERRGVLRQKQLPAAPGGPRRAPGRGSGGTRGGPGKPRSRPKENGPAAAPRWPPVSQDGPTGTDAPAKAKGKGRGAASAAGAPPASQNDSAGTGAAAKTKGKGGGAARGTPKSGGAAAAPPKFVAMDCEMVGTGPGGRTSALARCSIVTYEGDIVYDRYVRPEAPIVDYRTRWSGIRRHHMDKAVPFRRAQQQVRGGLRAGRCGTGGGGCGAGLCSSGGGHGVQGWGCWAVGPRMGVQRLQGGVKVGFMGWG